MVRLVKQKHWYLVVVCSGCQKEIPFAQAPLGEDEQKPRFEVVTCPQCGTKAEYEPTLVNRRLPRAQAVPPLE